MINQLIKHRQKMLVISIGIVYLWFGTLKLFPGLSPAEALAKETLSTLTFGLVPTNISYCMLALWEITIGVFLVLNFPKKLIIYIALLHILFTFTPLFLLPDASFTHLPYALTLVGQYIIKNLIIFSALLYILPQEQNVRT
jgi:uncharacterized membrane protein YkgB